VARERPPAKKPTGYCKPVLLADRLEEVQRLDSTLSIQTLATLFGKRPNWVWRLLRAGRLPDRIRDYVRGLGPYVKRSDVTLRPSN